MLNFRGATNEFEKIHNAFCDAGSWLKDFQNE
jgi:hypothetical protein